MNNELPSQKEQQRRSLDQCYADKPHMRERLLEISDMIDTLVAQGCTAHEAEARAIEEIRKLGNGILREWADKSQVKAVTKARAENPNLQLYRKKSPELALDLRRDQRLGAAAAAGAAWGASAALLPAGSDQQSRIFAAVATGAD